MTNKIELIDREVCCADITIQSILFGPTHLSSAYISEDTELYP